MMAKIGYARVSSSDQDTSLQVAALQAAGCTIVQEETGSGTKAATRPELQTALKILRPGDCLVVTRIDRLARSIGDLVQIVTSIESRGAALCCTEQPVDTSSAAGRCFLQMLGVFAEFETAIRRDRQMEGIARAKARGVYRGRKPVIDVAEVARLQGEGLGATAIARRLGIARASVYRVLRFTAA
jgi:DNA invertase Pin-like site-specific DNA recombinase